MSVEECVPLSLLAAIVAADHTSDREYLRVTIEVEPDGTRLYRLSCESEVGLRRLSPDQVSIEAELALVDEMVDAWLKETER